MATTLLLDRTLWDLVVDASGNIALASEPYSQAQDAASNIKLFQGELYYDTSQGIPYFTQVLGRSPTPTLLKELFVQAALAVPGVVGARCFLTSWANRALHGQVQITNSAAETSAAGF